MASFPVCAIEMEPKTLNPGQIHNAREIAVDIVQKMEPQEASDIFIQGLGQVDLDLTAAEEDNSEDSAKANQCPQSSWKHNDSMQSSRNCLCTAIISNSPDEIMEQPLTAPF